MNNYTIVTLIQKKQNGLELFKEEIESLISEFTAGKIPDYQMAAFLMAVYFRGMTFRETNLLTQSILNSGEKIDLRDVEGIKVDKHSTGGVGDKTSLLIAPIVAAAGIYIPMISGRGLGHTGGTLDKLESIPGFHTRLSTIEFKECLKNTGACLIGQTDTIVPADKKMYALRDVTATIASIPLITSSIMSKKLAEDVDALVLDVKVGRGGFFERRWDALQLAQSLVSIGKIARKKVIALLTDMNEPLGYGIGNWIEVRETIEALQGNGAQDLMEVTLTLAGHMLCLGGKAKKLKDGREKCKEIIDSGAAWKKFKEIVRAQHGNLETIEKADDFQKPTSILEIKAPFNGFIGRIDAYQMGMAAVHLGAGRVKQEDRIDPTAGIQLHLKHGDRVKKGDRLITLMTSRNMDLEAMTKNILNAYRISMRRPRKRKLILGTIK